MLIGSYLSANSHTTTPSPNADHSKALTASNFPRRSITRSGSASHMNPWADIGDCRCTVASSGSPDIAPMARRIMSGDT